MKKYSSKLGVYNSPLGGESARVSAPVGGKSIIDKTVLPPTDADGTASFPPSREGQNTPQGGSYKHRVYDYDVIVIGGGHAGVEAAAAAARVLSSHESRVTSHEPRVLLLTKCPDDLGAMSCNPSIGGPGKSQLVAEIDALGGIMPRAADMAGIHFRMLNASHGAATRALRAQMDRNAYRAAVKALLNEIGYRRLEIGGKFGMQDSQNATHLQSPISNLSIKYEPVESLDLHHKIVNGKYRARAIVITTGTFLGGLVTRGNEKIESGRMLDDGTYQSPDKNISGVLRDAGFRLIRLKTGTPARLYADSIDFYKCEVQPGDEPHEWFSNIGANNIRPQCATNDTNVLVETPQGECYSPLHTINCFITHTTAETHQIIRNNISDAPMYNGDIIGTGPRYCPSLEDKVMRFPEHESHHVFLEPEGLGHKAQGIRHNKIDLNGTYVPSQNAEPMPYALCPMPCDIIYPNGLSTSFGADVQDKFLRSIPGLENVRVARYGYAIEYDAIDARALKSTLESRDIPGLFFAGQINGTSGYEEAAAQGVVAGTNAAVYAMNVGANHIRPQCVTNGNSVLTETGRKYAPLQLDRTNSMIGVLIDDITTMGIDEPYRMFTSRAEFRLSLRADNAIARLGGIAVKCGLITEAERAEKYSRYASRITRHDKEYAGYIERQKREIERYRSDQNIKIPADFDYKSMPGLTNELIEKLSRTRPENIATLARIPGMTPAGVMVVLRKLKGGQTKKA